MTKIEERDNPLSCWNKANDHESMFVLLARDQAAVDTIYYWINRRIELGLNQEGDPQILEAAARADQMRLEFLDRQQALTRAMKPGPGQE